MYLHLCPECSKENHGRCWRVQPSHPPGSYGGSKCQCGCDGNPDYGKPEMTGADADKLRDAIKDMNFRQLVLLWRWITMEMGGRIEDGRYEIGNR